ncbi:MAG: alpha/beta fold hydrolase [Pseudomonadota bacterium]
MVAEVDEWASPDRAGHTGLGHGLHASVRGSGDPIILLHGLFGMGSNLGGIARLLAETHEVHQIDLPNHGRSSWIDAMSLSDMAEQLLLYLREHKLASAGFVGHSLGGKVAMQIAMLDASAVSFLVIADIAPIEYPASHDAVFAGIGAVERARPTSRQEAASYLEAHIAESAVVQFLLLSLKKEGDVYVWRFNDRVIRDHYEELRSVPQGSPYPGPALFVSGALSDYWPAHAQEETLRLFPAAELYCIDGTGHWLHAEKPDEFNSVVGAFLAAQDRSSAGAA